MRTSGAWVPTPMPSWCDGHGPASRRPEEQRPNLGEGSLLQGPEASEVYGPREAPSAKEARGGWGAWDQPGENSGDPNLSRPACAASEEQPQQDPRGSSATSRPLGLGGQIPPVRMSLGHSW